MKIFEEKYEALEYTLKKNNKEVIVKVVPITIYKNEEVKKIALQMQVKFETNHVYKLLSIVFGKKERFFKAYSIELLTDLMNVVVTDIEKKN